MKLLVREEGSARAIRLWLAADRVVSSLLLYPEVRAALARARRAGRLGARRLEAARVAAERLWGDVGRIGLTDELARRAGELSEITRLRVYDAVHLASAASVADDDLVLAAADVELLEAARAFRLKVAPLR